MKKFRTVGNLIVAIVDIFIGVIALLLIAQGVIELKLLEFDQ